MVTASVAYISMQFDGDTSIHHMTFDLSKQLKCVSIQYHCLMYHDIGDISISCCISSIYIILKTLIHITLMQASDVIDI